MENKHLKAKGSFYIKLSANKKKWHLYFQEYVDKKRIQKPVPKITFNEFGFKDTFTISEAKKRVEELNNLNKIEKIKIKSAAENLTRLTSLDQALFPENEVAEFELKLESENVGSLDHLKKLFSHFKLVQKLVKTLNLTRPQAYKDYEKEIYIYLSKRKVSLNYAKRIISLLNRWGKFQAKLKGHFYEDVNPPRGGYAAKIADEQKSKTGKNSELGVRTESSPLTAIILKKLKGNISDAQYNWLYLSLWLGLRPSEVDCLQDKKNYSFEYDKATKVHFIKIYQSKLKSVSADKRWKSIPIIFDEQKLLKKLIESKEFKRPLTKTLKKYSNDINLTLYGGRKNFVDMCLDAGQDYVDIAMWMGHKDTSTTFKHYKRRDIIRFKPVRKVA